jgi:hypothetical protein
MPLVDKALSNVSCKHRHTGTGQVGMSGKSAKSLHIS